MKAYEELLDILGDGELAYVSMEFWMTRDTTSGVLPKYIQEHPNHPIWKELNTFQNGWAACKTFYKISD